MVLPVASPVPASVVVAVGLLACGGPAGDSAAPGTGSAVGAGTSVGASTGTPGGTGPRTRDATTADGVWQGIQPGSALSHAAVLGDVDGDGTDDHLLQHIVDGTTFAGWVVSGAHTGTAPVDGAALLHLDVNSPFHPDFGAVGDVDGDGVADLSVSDQETPATVHLLSGTLRGTVDPYASAFATSTGAWTTRPWTDVDGDGADEWLAIERDNGLPEVQQLTVMPGAVSGPVDRSGAALATVELPTPDGQRSALGERGLFADLDGDGVDEWVSSDFAWGPVDGLNQVNLGRVLAFSLPLVGTVGPDAAVLDLAPSDGLGWELGWELGAGDLDGDGATDLAVAARGRDTDGGVFLFFQPLAATDLDDAGATVPGSPTERTGFGAWVGPIEAGGSPVLGVRMLDGPGALLLFEQPAGVVTADDARLRIVGAGPTDQLGGSGVVGDLDGDGAGEAVLGAPGALDGQGLVYRFSTLSD